MDSLRRRWAPAWLTKGTALAVLCIMLLWVAIPSYLQGQGPWVSGAESQALPELRRLALEGLTVPGWTTEEQLERHIGSGNWMVQDLIRPHTTAGGGSDRAILMLLPMKAEGDRPQIEWSDWQGIARLSTDQQQLVNLMAEIPGQSVYFQARLQRAWNPDRVTYAMLQWYAWPNGGHPDPSAWFRADRRAQLRDRRLPWVAVNLLIETDQPLDDLGPYRATLESLGSDVQAALITGPFAAELKSP